MTDNLYVVETTELSPEQFIELWRRGDEDHISDAVEFSAYVLRAAGYDMTRPPGFLVRDTAEHEEHNLAARVLYHAQEMARAVAAGHILDVRRHAMRFSTAVAWAQHLEAWGPSVRHRRKLNRANNARRHAEAAAEWAPRQEAWRALVSAGMSEPAARRAIRDQLAEQGIEVDTKILRRWLVGQPVGRP
jgi:glycerol-3-phosphate O-acyltransferase